MVHEIHSPLLASTIRRQAKSGGIMVLIRTNGIAIDIYEVFAWCYLFG